MKWTDGEDYVFVGVRPSATRNRIMTKEVISKIGKTTSIHLYDEALVKYLVAQLNQDKLEVIYES